MSVEVHPLIDLSVAVLFGISCLFLGNALFRLRPFVWSSYWEWLALSIGTGLGVLTLLQILLGSVGIYSSIAAWGTVIVPLLVTFRYFSVPPMVVADGENFKVSWWTGLFAVILGMYCLGYVLVAMTPTLEGDSLGGYLVTAREYAVQGRIVSVDWAYNNTFPANAQMLSSLGFLLRGQITAQLISVWLPGLLCVVILIALGKLLFGSAAVLLGITLWYSMYSVGYVSASGKVDLCWTAFDLLALLTFSRWYWRDSGQERLSWLLFSGLFLGLANGVKLASVLTGTVLGLAIIERYFRTGWNWSRVVRASLSFGLPVLVLGILWPVYWYWVNGNFTIFTGQGLTAEKGLLGFFRVIWSMSMLGNAVSAEGSLGKPIGPAFLACLPFLLLFRPLPRRVWELVVFLVLMLILSYNGVQRPRHLLPTLGLAALLVGYVVTELRFRMPLVGRGLVFLTALSLFLNLGLWSHLNFISVNRFPYLVGIDDRDAYLSRNLGPWTWLPNAEISQYIRDKLSPEARLAGLASGSGDPKAPAHSLYLERPLYVNWLQTPEEVTQESFVAMLKSSGVTHVYIDQFAVEGRKRRRLDRTWLAQVSFQDRYLRKLLCSGDECLFELRH